MPRRALLIIAAVLIVVLAGWWLRGGGSTTSEDAPAAAHRTIDNNAYQAFRRALGHVPRSGAIPWTADSGDGVTISGAVIDARDGKPIAGVEVVFRSPLGESTVTTGGDGAYSI